MDRIGLVSQSYFSSTLFIAYSCSSLMIIIKASSCRSPVCCVCLSVAMLTYLNGFIENKTFHLGLSFVSRNFLVLFLNNEACTSVLLPFTI